MTKTNFPFTLMGNVGEFYNTKLENILDKKKFQP